MANLTTTGFPSLSIPSATYYLPAATPVASTELQSFPSKPRVFILSDISNEPDDAESLVRYLLYSNQFETEGLVAITSTWLRDEVHPEDMHSIIDAYGEVLDNLNQHAHPDLQYPSVEHWRSIIKNGSTSYGYKAIDEPISDGAQLLVDRITGSDDPLWVLAWGGSNTLAQALVAIHETHSEAEAAALRARLRVYAISDQDDTGAWIRAKYPDIFYIASVHQWNQYAMAAWTGISGDAYYGFDSGGPDFAKVEAGWLKKNIQVGPLGKAYPDYKFIMEGDTPSFLYLVQNGLGVPEHPEYGSWGGRYGLTNLGLNFSHYSDTPDQVTGKDGATYVSNQATIWRWRDAFQDDFAARMTWTHTSLSQANHHPVAVLNGTTGPAPLELDVKSGQTVVLDAAGTYDPDGDALEMKWWQYREPTMQEWPVAKNAPEVVIRGGETVEVVMPQIEEEKRDEFVVHIVLEATDKGVPPLKAYRRVVLRLTK